MIGVRDKNTVNRVAIDANINSNIGKIDFKMVGSVNNSLLALPTISASIKSYNE